MAWFFAVTLTRGKVAVARPISAVARLAVAARSAVSWVLCPSLLLPLATKNASRRHCAKWLPTTKERRPSQTVAMGLLLGGPCATRHILSTGYRGDFLAGITHGTCPLRMFLP